MFKSSFINPRITPTRFSLAIAVVACLGGLGLHLVRRSVPAANNVIGPASIRQSSSAKKESPPQLSGEQARQYLDQTGEGQSLMAAVTAARFGLKWQERAPFGGESGGGYLGMSHDQNLNAWFDDEGATIRPTVAEKERAHAWQLGLRLKAYGYGAQMQTAPPIVARNVKDNRIEYERADCQLAIANCRFERAAIARFASGSLKSASDDVSIIFQSAIGSRKSAITEWYENRAEGIEQGVTINERPVRSVEVGANEPLRILLGVSGDLRARAVDDGHHIELVDGQGKSALSYSKLTSHDADGKQLAARMEASADGREIALVVEDEGARYPLVIDPIVASLEQKLDAGSHRQTDARFGFAVAIDFNTAVVGAWREDSASTVDTGAVYIFSRSGNFWSLANGALGGSVANDNCGYSVAVSGNRIVYGCPGANSNTGSAIIFEPGVLQASLTPPAGLRNAGDRYGTSVAIKGDKVVAGAPFNGNGCAFVFDIDSYRQQLAGADSGGQLATSVAIDGNTILLGEPNGNVFTGGTTITNAGIVRVWQSDGTFPSFWTFKQNLFAISPAAGDQFGQSVAISRNTAVVGAPLNGEKGTNAGAAYVFVRDTSGNWSQQQKLTASDARAGDVFGASHIAIEGNTIIVGSYAWDGGTPPFILTDDDRGAVYVFTRTDTVWAQQARILANDGDRGDNFGVGVGISLNSVIVGSRGATLSGTTRAGAAYVYRLDCVPPYSSLAVFFGGTASYTACPGSAVDISAFTTSPTGAPSFQWRKNGVNIPGATFSSYSINRASASDAGNYDVVISTSCGSDTSNAVTLTVHTFSINPTSQNFGASGSTGIVNVTSTGSSCSWTAVSNSSFITVNSGSSGTGNGTVGFTVAANPNSGQRTGTMTIAGKTFTVTQDGTNCSYSIAPTSQNLGASASTNTVNVTASAGCAWTATSNDPFLSINSGASGSGNGTVTYTVTANNGPARTGTLTVAGQTVAITQASGCTYSISPTTQNFPASVAAGAVNVTTVAGCTWTAQSNAPSFIAINSGASGTGNGTVGFTVAANTGPARTGTITIAGQTFTVTQDGAAASTPTVQFSAASYNVGEGDQRVTLTVTRTGDASGAATVRFATDDAAGAQNCNVITGVASSRCDYETRISTIRFAGGETAKTISIFIIDDSYLEGTENFTVSLSNPTGVSLGAQSTASVAITDNEIANGVNPIDTASFFVQLHYLDFLNRDPDSSGLAFWSGEIASCGTNAQCIESKRINVSAAFYLSIEFQQTGYLIERIYKAAYGNSIGTSTFGGSHQLSVPVVRLNEFLPDTQEIGQGVIVGQTGWEQVLENNKQAFTAGFVQRVRFTTAYPNSITAAQFVDTLNINSGNPLSPSERDGLVGDLTSGTKTRAQVLRAVAEDPDLVSAESNRAFVLMQFFGYLRRNPNDPQDTDYTGYDFWLTKLNQFNGNFVNAEMVRAFISSSEYRQRFGP